jgi:hypothetical protein
MDIRIHGDRLSMERVFRVNGISKGFHGYELAASIFHGDQRLYKRPCKQELVQSRVEAGSNASTVALRVVGGDEKGSLESETVEYGRKSHGTRTLEWVRWRGPSAVVNHRPVISSERALNINKPATNNNKNLVVSPR